MDESRLRTIEQLKEFLNATPLVSFAAPGTGADADRQRYDPICRVLKRFDYPQCDKRDRGVIRSCITCAEPPATGGRR